jgi:cob(I)alamin adenosyltransferase
MFTPLFLVSFIFTKFQHEMNNKGKVTSKRIDLMQKASTERSNHFNKREHFVLDGLLKMKAAASDIQTAIRLFQEVDEDNSGRFFLFFS